MTVPIGISNGWMTRRAMRSHPITIPAPSRATSGTALRALSPTMARTMLGDDQPEERQRPHRHDDGRRYDGDDGQPECHRAAVVEPEVRRERLPHPRDSEPIRHEPGDEHERPRHPEQFEAPGEDGREVTGRPGAQALEQVGPVGDERRERPDDAAQHQAEQRDEQDVPHRHRAQHAQEQARPRQGGQRGERHARPDGGVRPEQRAGEQSQGREVERPGRGGFHEDVAGEELHDQPGDGQPGTREHERERAWEPADQQDVPLGAPGEDAGDADVRDSDNQGRGGEPAQQRTAEHKDARPPRRTDPATGSEPAGLGVSSRRPGQGGGHEESAPRTFSIIDRIVVKPDPTAYHSPPSR